MSQPPFAGVAGICFDLDDTLCGYWEAARLGLARTFALHPVSGHTPEQIAEVWRQVFRTFCPSLKENGWYDRYCASGESTRTEQMRRTLAAAGVPDEAFAKMLSETYGRERSANLKLFPESIQALQALADRFPLGVITNGPADVQRQEIATLGIGSLFAHVVVEGELGVGKPSSRVFRHAEQLFGLQPDQMLMVGNSYRHDVQGAIAAGWRTAWIRRPSDVGMSGTKPEQRPEDGPEPDIEIHDLRQLLESL